MKQQKKMNNFKKEYKKYLANKNFIWSSVLGFALVIFSLFVNYWAAVYATKKASNIITDIVLSNIPSYNVAGIFVFGLIAFIFFVIFIAFKKPERIPFITKSTAVFMLIRSAFISMTHLAPYQDAVSINISILNKITTGGDMFFSGHTGLPFLMALIFWKQKNLRYLFLAVSVGFGAIALMGHYHYTIDVFAAFFITFGIYHICLKIFKKDYQYFINGV